MRVQESKERDVEMAVTKSDEEGSLINQDIGMEEELHCLEHFKNPL
jgi:hypothetical protein